MTLLSPFPSGSVPSSHHLFLLAALFLHRWAETQKWVTDPFSEANEALPDQNECSRQQQVVVVLTDTCLFKGSAS